MKKYLLLSAVACTLAGCSNDFNPADVVVDKGSNTETKEAPIGFSATNKNMLRDASKLEESHYNFGVFAYKNTDNTNPIMADYLVGYMDATGKKGYNLTISNQTTLGGSTLDDNKSYWAYEKLGNTEYSHTSNTSEEHYYTKTEEDKFYLSNNTNQYLRYWDYSSASTNFYAYAPYYHHDGVTGVTLTNNSGTSYTLTLPDGSIIAGYDDRTKHEAMYAAAHVENTNYGKDVALTFTRISSKIRIAFYEDIAGYSVQMKPLTPTVNISAAPAKKNAGTSALERADLRRTAGATISFTNSENNYTIGTVTFTGDTHYGNDDYLKFTCPEGIASPTVELPQHSISASKITPLPETDYSPTVYYAIPKSEASEPKVGLTFHISFQLTSTTGETILVQDARVHVPGENCQWASNKQYTYIFKITKNTTGTTESSPTISPSDAGVPTTQALYPIVFDGCTVEEWGANTDYEHTIN